MNASTPEEAIVDAVISDPLIAATLLVHLANRDSLSIRAGLLDDIAREQNITSQKLETLLEALLEARLLSQARDGIALTVPKNDALRHAAVLRGVAYARYRQRDANQVEITLSPPAGAHISRDQALNLGTAAAAVPSSKRSTLARE
jgi:hypothetical protein